MNAPKLSEYHRDRFTKRDIERGKRIFESGRVGALQRSEGELWLDVKGDSGRSYQVYYDQAYSYFDCDCPRYMQWEACKHAWAALLFWDRLLEGALRPSWEYALEELAQAEEGERLSDSLRISYGLHLDSPRPAKIELRVYAQKRLKNGGWGKHRVLGANESAFPAEDAGLIALLKDARRVGEPNWSYGYGSSIRRSFSLELTSSALVTILEPLVATGRFFAVLDDDQFGEALTLDLNSVWRPHLELGPGDPRLLKLAFRCEDRVLDSASVRLFLPPFWFLADGQFHRIDDELDCRWLSRIAPEGIAIAADQVDKFYQRILATSMAPFVELDQGWKRVELDPESVGRVIQILPLDANRCRLMAQFDYDGVRVAHDAQRLLSDSEQQRVINRLWSFESDCLQRTSQALGIQPQDLGRLDFSLADVQAPLDELAREGFAIEVEGKALRRSGTVQSKVSSGTDWFDLEGGIDFEGELVSYPEILAGLKKGSRFIELSDGSRGILPQEWERRLSLLEAASPEGSALRFRRNQGILIDLLLEATAKPSLDASFKKMSRGLRDFQGVNEAKEPRGFKGELRPYQRKGLGWLSFLRKIGLGGCLADDMGLGKTVQVLALLQTLRGKRGRCKPFLVVAPKSVITNWIDEARRFAPTITALEYAGPQRKALLKELAPGAILVTTYGLLRRDVAALREVEFDTVILDEAQAIKNVSSQTAKAARVLNGEHRLALSGTPIENRIDELWSIFEFLNPGMFPSMKLLHDLGAGDEADRRRLGQLISPFLLRRRKEEVAPDLPPRTEQTLVCELSSKQRQIYDDVLRFQRLSVLKRLKADGLQRSKLHVLEALLRLRQIACHPALVNSDYKKMSSSKVEMLLEQLGEVIAEGHKALVFSQFTSLLAIVREALDKAKIDHEYLDGRTRNRPRHIERFQTDPNCKAFLISLKAGGTGLNLTAADYVFILDPWWNPAVEAQAIDRTHRIGQTKAVVAYRLIAKDTIEEKILALQERKKELADSILEGNAKTLRDLGREDIEALFA